MPPLFNTSHAALAVTPPLCAQVDQLLATRFHAKRSRNFDAADDAQESLRALGVEVDDQNYSWRFNEGNASF
jgi:cysteinyl-tRNA synthetase